MVAPISGVFEIGETRSRSRFAPGVQTQDSGRTNRNSSPLGQGKGTAESPDGRFQVLLDGYFTNRRALRLKLLNGGRSLRTEDDAEVALACFEQYGIDAFDLLDGAFSLAIYDRWEEELFLVRDRVGQMPLYYHSDGHRFLFASDLRKVVQGSSLNLPMSTSALEAYLQLTYIPAPWTIYEGVLKLLPGTYLRVGVEGPTEPTVYWDIDYSEGNQVHSQAECKDLLRDALFQSVEECLHTVGDAGTLLSGGIDSTIITGIASKVMGRQLDTFTIGFEDRRYDETARAQLSADLHRTNHQVIRLNSSDVLPDLDQMLCNLDEPYGDSSYLPATMVARAARRHVGTVLSGDAGDELFAGYSKYLIGDYAGAFNRVPKWLSGPAIHAANMVLPAQAPLRRKINKVAESATLSPLDQSERLMSLGFPPGGLETPLRGVPSNATHQLIREYYEKYSSNRDEMRRVFYLDFKVVLEGDMMPKMYYAGREVGLRTTVPMLTRNVVEVAAQIPTAFKINKGVTKAILKETFDDLIPPDLLTAPKSGFSIPLGSWLRGDLRASVEDLLSEDRIRSAGILNYPEVNRLLDEHFQGRADHSGKLWSIYVFQSWQERAIG